ncbi:hypothetical protein D3C87_1548630 [compost metagenome]
MAMVTPSARISPSFSMTSSGFSISSPSVISISSRLGARPELPSALCTTRPMSERRKCRADRFTATVRCAGQAAAAMQAALMVQSPISTIRSDCSAMAMNSAGGTSPRVGWFQRTSASKPVGSPSVALTRGW